MRVTPKQVGACEFSAFVMEKAGMDYRGRGLAGAAQFQDYVEHH